MSKFVLKWNDNLAGGVHKRAQAAAIDTVMAHCVTTAKTLVRRKTTLLQGSIRFEPAVSTGNATRGIWGSFDVDYAIYQEIGPITGKRQWAFTPYLRPARDQHYPELVEQLRKRFAQVLSA